MIKAVIVMNTQGRPRLTKFYDFQHPDKQQELIRTLYSVLCNRPENVSNFVNVDSIFGPLHTIVDEIIFGGQVLETNSAEVIRAVEAISKLEASSTTNRFVPKSVSSWRR
ncbi:hypothetical protein SOVF_053500 [Spinacia oleracea]|nr:hypothetical protein SOVF_053500 [Spinacia oleracea]